MPLQASLHGTRHHPPASTYKASHRRICPRWCGAALAICTVLLLLRWELGWRERLPADATGVGGACCWLKAAACHPHLEAAAAAAAAMILHEALAAARSQRAHPPPLPPTCHLPTRRRPTYPPVQVQKSAQAPKPQLY